MYKTLKIPYDIKVSLLSLLCCLATFGSVLCLYCFSFLDCMDQCEMTYMINYTKCNRAIELNSISRN